MFTIVKDIYIFDKTVQINKKIISRIKENNYLE